MLFVFFPIGSNDAHLIVHPVVLFDGGSKERPVVLLFRSKAMAAAAIFHGIMRDVGHGDPGWMQPALETINVLT